MTFEELQKIVYDAGIVGAGGAGFPTHRKFSDKVKQIIVNAAECEPLMMVDHHILEHHLQALVDTLNVLIDTMGADEAIIGIKGKNMHLLDTKIVASRKSLTFILPVTKLYLHMKQQARLFRREQSL